MPARTHGQGGTPEYRAWKAMKNRCYNQNFKQWKDYGGRGITVCDAWYDDFTAFLLAVGPRPSQKYILDRENNDKGYEPGNVRWVTRRTSNLNRRSCRIIDGQPAAETALRLGIKPKTLQARIRRGWSADDAMNHPVRRGYHPRPSLGERR